MFGMSEMLFIFVMALLLFGPKKLPEIGRQIGKMLAEFKRASNEFQATLNDEVRKLELENAAKQREEVAQPSGQMARGALADDAGSSGAVAESVPPSADVNEMPSGQAPESISQSQTTTQLSSPSGDTLKASNA